ncbi:hypothetical protein ACFSX5_16320 [Devosia albogilva]|uniref:Uncharacterized protein n=1 Tax=Devosia albogilva TaxID=429726 RepID=A0ABW5QNL0_9HYPH
MRKSIAIAITWAAVSLPAVAFDAGGFALQQHQHQLLQQQTAPNNSEESDGAGAGVGAETYDSLRTRYMKQLQPEYEMRVRRDGPEAAQAWLKREAGRLGREAAGILQSQ